MSKACLFVSVVMFVGLASLGYCQLATLYVQPETTIAAVNDTFVIGFNITNVRDLAAWQIGLNWDASVLGYKWVREGPFLRDSGSTFFVKNEDDTANGFVLVGCVYMPLKCRSGSGNLAYCCFRVKRVASTTFAIDDINNTFLLDTNIVTIPCLIRNGYFRPRVAINEPSEGFIRDREIVSTPNPFTKNTAIRLPMADVNQRNDISLAIYDAEGRLVKQFNHLSASGGIEPLRRHSYGASAASNYVIWDGRDDKGHPLPAGVYVGRVKLCNQIKNLSIILVR